MADDEDRSKDNEEPAKSDPAAEPSAAEPATDEPSLGALTQDMRRLLGGPRSLRKRNRDRADRAGGEEEEAAAPPVASTPAPEAPIAKAPAGPTQIAPPNTPRRIRTQPAAPVPGPAASPASESEEREVPGPEVKKTRSGQVAVVDQKTTRAVGMHNAIIVLGALFLLFLTFYVGKNYQRWKYMLFAPKAPEVTNTIADKFPNVPAEDLIQQAFAAEAAGDWRGATDRWIAAKYKDRGYRGILFRVGRILYDQKEFGLADGVFANAVLFGENADTANFYRGLIATARKNLAAAAQFFQQAAAVEPLVPIYYYYWAEALRLDQRPREALVQYQQASLRVRTQHDRSVYQFKTRMCELEGTGSVKVAEAIAEKKKEGPLSVDWLLTAAALSIHEGRVDEAVRLIGEAREAKHPGLFMGCIADSFFRDAASKNPQIAAATKLDFDPAMPAFP